MPDKNTVVEEITVKDQLLITKAWITFFLKRWWLLLIFLVIGAITAISYRIFSPKKYTAQVNFVLDESAQSSGINPISGLAAVMGGDADMSGNLFSGTNLIWLYTSQRMVGETLLSTVKIEGKEVSLINLFIPLDNKLEERYKEVKSLSPHFKGFPNKPLLMSNLDSVQLPLINFAISRINQEYLTVSNVDQTAGIIQVSLIIKDSRFPYYFTTKIVDYVNDFYIKTKTKKERDQVEILQHKVDEFYGAMNTSLYEAARGKEIIPFANPNRSTLQVNPRKSEVDFQTNSGVYSALLNQLEKAKVALMEETPLIQVIDKPLLPLPVSRPNLKKFIPIFCFIFFVLGVGILFAKEKYKMIMEDNIYPDGINPNQKKSALSSDS